MSTALSCPKDSCLVLYTVLFSLVNPTEKQDRCLFARPF